jgi:hypothetical protein
MTDPMSNAVAVRDYVAGRLSDAARQAFEERLLLDARLVREVEASLRLREGLEMLREQGVLGELRRPQRRALRMRFVRAAVAAAVVGALIVVASQLLYPGTHSPPVVAASIATLRGDSSAPPRVIGRYSFAAMRGAASTPELPVPKEGALEVRALTARADTPRTFKVTLVGVRDTTTPVVGVVEHVAPDADGFIAVYADVAQLQPGAYALVVEPEGISDPTAGSRFAFKLKRSAN